MTRFLAPNIAILISTLILAMASCAEEAGQGEAEFQGMLDDLLSGSVPMIDSKTLAKRLDESPEMLLLDAREREEYEVSHLKDALWVGHKKFDPATVKDLDRAKPVVIYCSVGYRSEKIGEKLKELGFKEVRNLRGGIFDWANLGLPIEDQSGESTQSVHPYNRRWGKWLHPHVEKKYRSGR